MWLNFRYPTANRYHGKITTGKAYTRLGFDENKKTQNVLLTPSAFGWGLTPRLVQLFWIIRNCNWTEVYVVSLQTPKSDHSTISIQLHPPATTISSLKSSLQPFSILLRNFAVAFDGLWHAVRRILHTYFWLQRNTLAFQYGRHAYTHAHCTQPAYYDT